MKALLFLLLIGLPQISESAKHKYIIVEENNKKGLINDKGELLIPALYDDLGWSKGFPEVLENVLGYKKGHLWGLINIKNQKIADPVYATVYPGNHQNIIASRFNQYNNEILYGMIDLKGNTLISFKYYTLEAFDDHLIASIQRVDRVYGIVTRNDKSILPVQYRKVEYLLPSFYKVKQHDGKNAFFHAKTKKLSAFEYDSIFRYNDEYVIVVKGGKQGVMNKDGRLLIAPQYKRISFNEDNTINVLPFNQWHLLNPANEKINSCFFDEIRPVGDNVLKATIEKNEALIDLKGNLSSSMQHYKIGNFKNNYAVISNTGKYGVVAKNGGLIIPLVYDSVIINNDYFFVNKALNKKPYWSILDLDGKVLNGPEYHDLIQLNRDLFAVKVNKYWGLTSSSGEGITTCKFDTIELMDDGNLLVRYYQQYGIIDPHGEWVIMPKSEKLVYVKPGLYVISSPFCSSLLIKDGKDIHCSSGQITKRKNDLIEIRPDGKMGLFSFSGSKFLDTRYDEISELQNDSVYVFRKEGLFGIMTKHGKMLTDNLEFEAVYPLREEFLGVKLAGKFGFIDVNGKLRIANRYDTIGYYQEGFAAIKLLDKWGFIDKMERIKVQPRYDEVQPFYNGLSLVKLNNKYGLVDGNDRTILPIEFDHLDRIQNGRYISFKNGKYGLIGTNGKELVFPKYDEIQDLKNGFLIIQRRGKYGTATADGELVIPMLYQNIIYDEFNNLYLAVEPSEWKSIKLN